MYFSVTRIGGVYGGVQVNYELYNAVTGEKALNGGDFAQAEGLNVRFEKGSVTQTISLTPRADGKPEVSVTYTVKLTSVEGKELTLPTSVIC